MQSTPIAFYASKWIQICILLALYTFVPISWGKSDTHSLQEAYAKVAEKAFPAVVVVINYQYDHYGLLEEAGIGSGFFVRSDGVLITNHHVIEGADVLAVRFQDEKVYPAYLLQTSPATDLAIVQAAVDKKVPVLKFADTSSVKVGHYTIAIGAPLALSHTMTTGVVSFKGRKLGMNYKEDFIQTDAAINPGNSGGPLLNIDGLVIGVNDCGMMPDGKGSIGLNFAIDGNLAQKTLGGLLSRGLRKRPSFGVTVEETSPEGHGVLVTKVIKDGAAQKAGLKKGDVITRLGENKVIDILQFQALVLSEYSPGDKTTVEFTRNGESQCGAVKFQ